MSDKTMCTELHTVFLMCLAFATEDIVVNSSNTRFTHADDVDTENTYKYVHLYMYSSKYAGYLNCVVLWQFCCKILQVNRRHVYY